ncbi:MAG: BolA family transcriptional regulator [Planctomycetota bacterium]
MITPEEIQKTLQEALPESEVHVADLTGTRDHYQVIVIAPQFQDASLIDQHRMVYAPLQKQIGGDIHALAIKTMTPEQWKSQQAR